MEELRTVKILFDNGVVVEIAECADFEIKTGYNTFFIHKNGHYIMVPKEHVLYIGYKEDLE